MSRPRTNTPGRPSDDASQIEDPLMKVLSQHFEGINDTDEIASVLRFELGMGRAIESLNAMDRPPEKDKEQLEKAVTAIGEAFFAIKGLGYHGAKHLSDVIPAVFPDPFAQGYVWTGSAEHSKEFLADHFAKLKKGLEIASNNVDLNGASYNTAFGEGPDFEKFSGVGKQKAATARAFALALAKVYHDKTGRRPTVSTRAIPNKKGHEAYGPFLDFVRDAFKAVGVEESPETWARAAHKSFKDFSAQE